MDLTKITKMISRTTCFIAHVETNSFNEAIAFLDFIDGLPGNMMKNQKIYLVLMIPTATIDYGLFHNKTK